MPHALLTTRFAALPAPSPADALCIEPGGVADYAALAEHHYRAGRPAMVSRVLVIRADDHGAAARFTGRRRTHPVAVLVESLGPLHARLRDVATAGRYAALRDPRQRAAVLNDELRCISRVVVHPQWRGLGLAVRLVRHALDTATTPMTEAFAAMGRVHPFFAKAGMTAYDRPLHPADARLCDALASAGLTPQPFADAPPRAHARHATPPGASAAGGVDPLSLCDPRPLARALHAHPRAAWLRRELTRWHATIARRRTDATVEAMLTTARRRLLSIPVYYLAVKPESRSPESTNQIRMNKPE